MSPGEFNKFLVNWREQLRVTLRSDPAGYLGRKYNGAACHITAQFPDRTVLRAYAQPSTSWSQVAGRKTIMRMARGESCQPNVTGLADFCVRFFEWSPELLCEKFAKIVWPGACLKMLCQVSPIFLCNGAANHLCGLASSLPLARVYRTFDLGQSPRSCDV